MKPAAESRPSLGVKKNEFMQASTFNFLENERRLDVVHRGAPAYQPDECDGAIAVRDGKAPVKTVTRSHEVLGKSSKDTSNLSRTQAEAMPKQAIVSTETRKESGRYAPKRYVTKCYFQPKPNPVSYSETVILTLGSNKKHYFETVLYQTKLVPFRWTESMTTLTPAAEGEVFEVHHEAFVQEPKYHYMSLEPQQIAAIDKANLATEVAV